MQFDKLYLYLIDGSGEVYAKVFVEIYTQQGKPYALWPQPSYVHHVQL